MLKRSVTNTIFMMITFLLILLLLFYSYFRIIKESTFRVNEQLSTELSEYVKDKVGKIPVINGIQVVRTDVKRNSRAIIYAYQIDDELRKIFSSFIRNRITMEIPLFSDNFSQNVRTIRMMDHQFECVPYVDTLTYEYVPESAKFITTACSISIPPAYGEFKGILVVTLKRTPSDLEEMIVKETLIDLSNKIYLEIKQ